MAVRLIDFNHTGTKEDLPEIKPGHVVKVHQKISETKVTGKKTETKERIQIFEGLVIGVKGGNGINATITVRKISGGIGVERIFPVHAPTIEKIEITKVTKARRAKLNYMRDRVGKATQPKGELATEADNKPRVKKEIKAETETEEAALEEVVAETEEKVEAAETETVTEETKEEEVAEVKEAEIKEEK
jgi:large subunit ribosomal protein L19